MKITTREIKQIIESLRYWQNDMDMDGFESVLALDEIDDLCERLNFVEGPIEVVEVQS